MNYSITLNTSNENAARIRRNCVRKGNRWEAMYAFFNQTSYSLNDVYRWKERNAIDTDNQYFIVKAEQ